MKKTYLFAFGSTLLWGSSAAVVKLLLKNLSNVQILFYSSIFASISLFIIVIFQRKLNLIKTYKLIDYLRFAYMGFIGVFIYYFSLYLSLYHLKAQEAFIINYLWPIIIVILAMPILKEKFTIRKILAVIISFLGVIFIVSKGSLYNIHFQNITGVLFALLAAVSYGLFSVLGKKHNYDKTTSMMFYYIFTFIYTLITLKIFGYIPTVTGFQILGLVWTGVFTSGLAFLFWFLALQYGDTSKVSNIAFITPFLSLIYIYFLLGEKIEIYSIIGLLFIILGIYIQSVELKKIQK